MPYYDFKNKETGEEIELFMWISQYDQYLKDNPHMERIYRARPTKHNVSTFDEIKLGRKKPDEGFRDILRDIKKGSGRGANINTFD